MQPAILVSSTLDEETARAEIYGVLAALFYAAPTPALLESLQLAVTEAPAAGALLEASWTELVATARAMSVQEVVDEYDALFGGVGSWAVMTDLAGAVIAPATVVVAGNIKKVQHPTGGVVKDILVKNGDHVKSGDVVLLSPACASLDMFRDYAHRGDVFAAAVQGLSS